MIWPTAARISRILLCAVALAAGLLSASAQTQAPPVPQPPKKQKVTLPALAAQGFEVKGTVGSYLVVQRGKDVWLCYMLDTRSDCTPAE
jgi:CubicO group peptidase (beta-lactamase class C family)